MLRALTLLPKLHDICVIPSDISQNLIRRANHARISYIGGYTMKLSTSRILSTIAVAVLLVTGAFAQGKSKSKDKPATTAPTTTTMPTTGESNTKTAKTTSRTNSTANASTRTMPANKPPSDKELNRYNGISQKLNVSTTDLRTQYETALTANPNLTFGNFVSANVVANNLSAKNPSITTEAILTGMQSGDSLGKTLQKLGMTAADAKAAEKEAKKQIKDSQKATTQKTTASTNPS